MIGREERGGEREKERERKREKERDRKREKEREEREGREGERNWKKSKNGFEPTTTDLFFGGGKVIS